LEEALGLLDILKLSGGPRSEFCTSVAVGKPLLDGLWEGDVFFKVDYAWVDTIKD
jgi:hypothetical protein